MLLTIVVIVIALPVLLLILGWVGLQFRPARFPAYPEQTPPLRTVALPADLPAPVARYYETIAGGREIPVIESAVLTGPARLRFNGITFNSRFRFTHAVGQAYRHYLELTVFGVPLLKANESFLDGVGRLELPFGVEEGMEINQGANLALWGEAIWFPSAYLTDSRVRWEAADATTARLIVPWGEQEEQFTVVFDPATGLIASMEALRHKEVGGEKIPWRMFPEAWGEFHGVLIPVKSAVQWGDDDQPWAHFTIEDAAYNVDVSQYLRQKGL